MANESLNYERQQALSALLRNDFGSFIEKAFNEINGQGTFRSSQHIDLMSKLLEEVIEGRTRRATISIAPRTLKSFVCVVCYVAFVLGRTPTRKFIILSHDLALAEKHADLIRSILDSVWFQSLFPNTRLKPGASRRGNFETTRGGRVYATSIDAGLTGHGADEIIIDDPMDADRARNIVARRELVRTFDEKIVSRLDDNNKGVVLVIAQRLAIDDLVGVLDQRTEFFSLSVPAEATEDLVHSVGEYRWVRPKGDIIDPENLDVDFLESRRKHMGQAAFSSQYQQNPAVAGGGIVERAWLQEFDLVPDGPWTIVLTIDVGQGLNDHSSGPDPGTWSKPSAKNRARSRKRERSVRCRRSVTRMSRSPLPCGRRKRERRLERSAGRWG